MYSPYDCLITKPIQNDLLICDEKEVLVTLPSLECILGDKLTAFAPHTTGIPLGKNKEMEIAKQFFDVSVLAEHMKDQKQFQVTYANAVKEELSFRGLNLDKEAVLSDTIRACISIISRGKYDKDDYAEYLRGIRSLSDHILGRKFTPEIASEYACSVMCLAASVLKQVSYPLLSDPSIYEKERLASEKYKNLAYIKKKSLKAYGFLVEAIKMLET